MALRANRLKLLAPGRMTMFGGSLLAAQGAGGVALLAQLGMDYVELEAAALKASCASAMAQLGRAMGVPAIVRVPEAHRAHFGPALEGGAWGLSIPGVNSLDAAGVVVSATRYWPEGDRGTFEPGPQNDYLDDPQDLLAVNGQVHVTIRVDPAIDRLVLQDMARLDGIDAIEFEMASAREVAGTLAPSVAAVRASGIIVSAAADTPADIALLAEAGVQMIRLANDVDLIASHFEKLVAEIMGADLRSGEA